MLFWTLAVVMLLLALLLLLPTLLRQSVKAQSDTKPHNVIIAKERLTELEAELAAGTISQDIFEQTKDELEQGLLEDVSVAETKASESSVLFDRFGLLVVLLLVPAMTITTYFVLGAPQHVDVKGPGTPNVHAGAAGQKVPTMDELLVGLETRVKEDPENPEGWFMLGRVYSSMGRHEDASKAFEQLRGMTDDHPAALLGLADSLAMQNDGKVAGKPMELVLKALEAEPDSVTGLWLAGKGAKEVDDYQNALYYWRQAEAGLAGDQNMLPEIQRLISGLKSQAAQAGQQLDDPGSSVAAPVAQISPAPQDATGSAIMVEISIAPELQDKVSAGDQLFLFARQTSGPPMPVAAIKRSASELPLQIVLDDSAILSAGAKLADYPKLKVAARITKGGEPMAKSGDLQSGSIVFAPGKDRSIQLIIDQIFP